MHPLDDQKRITRLDPGRVLESIELFPEQCEQAWREAKRVKMPPSYRRCKRILVNGMGGSGLGTHVLQGVFGSSMRVPFELIQSYTLPRSAGPETLYIASSYSGTTEEVVATLPQAVRQGVKLLAIAKGGDIASFFRRKKLPIYQIHDDANPSGQPRLGLGYAVFGLAALLRRLGFLALTDRDVRRSVALLRQTGRRYGVNRLKKTNRVKQLVTELEGRTPIIVAAEHLSGAAHVLANQLNETSKTFAVYFLLSKLNHHLLEGLRFPRSNRQHLAFLFYDSLRYTPKMRLRLKLTEEIVRKHGIPTFRFRPDGRTTFEEALAALQFGSFVSFYLAMLNGVDPVKIRWVDTFKAALKRAR